MELFQFKSDCSRARIQIQTHENYPSWIFIMEDHEIMVIRYDLEKQEKETIYQNTFEGDPWQRLKYFIFLNDSFSYIFEDSFRKATFYEQSFDLSLKTTEYDFKTQNYHIANKERTLLFGFKDNLINAYDLVNKCYIESLSFVMPKNERAAYLTLIDSKNQLVIKLQGEMQKAYILTIAKRNNDFLKDGLYQQNLPIQRLEVDYYNQKYFIFCDIDQNLISSVQQQFTTDDLKDLINLRTLDDLQIIDCLKRQEDISKFLMHYPQIGNLISLVAFKPRVLQYLIKRFELSNQKSLPMLMFYAQGQSPLDRVTHSNQIKSTICLVEMLVKFQNHYSFNHFVDKVLISLIEKNINLNEYFESNLPLIKINHKNYPDLHVDDSELLLGLSEVNIPYDIIDRYDEIFSEHLDQSDIKQQQQPIEYYLVNLPQTLTQEPRRLMEVLAETEQMELFETLSIQSIINFNLLIGLEEYYPYEDFIIIIKLAIVFLTFLKINFFLRIYDGFSFLVSMMAAVFVDLKYFIGFFLIFIIEFGLIFAILFDAISIDEYSGIGIFAYLMMAFRTSSGDFNVDSYKDQSSALVIISWGVWIIAVMLLNVMFMNFIIAVISESYEKVMQKLVAEGYKVKVQMIVERELHFSKEELTSEKYFPRYLLLRRPVSSSDSESGEWQGFVKDIKNTIKTTTTKQKQDFQQEISSQCQKLQDVVNTNIQEVNQQLQNQDSKMEQINKQQTDKIEQLNKQLTNFINDQQQQNAAILQLLQNIKPQEIKQD
eukprot:403366420